MWKLTASLLDLSGTLLQPYRFPFSCLKCNSAGKRFLDVSLWARYRGRSWTSAPHGKSQLSESCTCQSETNARANHSIRQLWTPISKIQSQKEPSAMPDRKWTCRSFSSSSVLLLHWRAGIPFLYFWVLTSNLYFIYLLTSDLLSCVLAKQPTNRLRFVIICLETVQLRCK